MQAWLADLIIWSIKTVGRNSLSFRMQCYQTTAYITTYKQKMHKKFQNCIFDVDYMSIPNR